MKADDDDARRAISDALDDTLVVEAAAGTGKTTELIKRILSVLATGRARMKEIVAVTFTEKAAGELKLRLREALEQARADAGVDTVRDLLEDALKTLEDAHVNTIHGFCAELLRERPVEASVDPLFAVLTEPQADRLYARAFRTWLQESLQDPPEGLRRALRRTSAMGDRSASGSWGPGASNRRSVARRPDERSPSGATFPRPWKRPPFDRASRIDRLVTAAARARRSDRCALVRARQPVHRHRRGPAAEPPDPARAVVRATAISTGGKARLVDLARDRAFSRARKGSGYKFGKDVTRSAVLGARDALMTGLQEFRRDADADLAACLQQELAAATAGYQALKQAAGALDFADLLVRARDLIAIERCRPRHLQQKFARIFVDEFQDTDPVQADILLLLAADDPRVEDPGQVRPIPGKLFIVGDPKQAIYRFRGTDVATYWRVSRQLAERGGRVLQLTTSYRSVPAIQRFVNAAFDEAMRADELALQAGYVPLAPFRPADDSQPAGRGAAGAEAVRPERSAEGLGQSHRDVAARRGRRVHRLADR